jgi:hypothetical protein
MGDLLKGVQHQLSGSTDAHNISLLFETDLVPLGIQRPGIFIILLFFYQTAFFVF